MPTPIIYIYMPTWLHSLYLFIQIQNTEICTVYRKSAKKYRDMYRIPQVSQKILRYEFLLILPSPTLKKRAFGNILLDSPSCGLRTEDKSFFFFLTKFIPFKFEYNSNFDNILVKNLNVVFQPIWQPYCHWDTDVTLQTLKVITTGKSRREWQM